MAIEFTRLADVTAIEEVKEEDSVLVVQDGEVKRAPKTAVGGAGGGGFDLLVSRKYVEKKQGEIITLIVGDYTKILQKVQNAEPVFAALSTAYVPDSNIPPELRFFIFNEITKTDNDGKDAIYFYDYYQSNYCYLYSDNTVESGSYD